MPTMRARWMAILCIAGFTRIPFMRSHRALKRARHCGWITAHFRKTIHTDDLAGSNSWVARHSDNQREPLKLHTDSTGTLIRCAGLGQV